MRRRILRTEGVSELVSYESAFDPQTRKITVSAEISTVYGPTPVNISI